MNNVHISGKVFNIKFNESGNSGSLNLYKFNKKNNKGETFRVFFICEAVQQMKNIKERDYIEISGWLKQDQWEYDNKKYNRVCIYTTNISKLEFPENSTILKYDNDQKEHNVFPDPKEQESMISDRDTDVPF